MRHPGFTVRPFRQTDLPIIAAAASQTGWEYLTPAERAVANPQEVAHRASQQIIQSLSMPGTICLVGEEGGQVVAYEIVMVRPDEVSGIVEGLKLDGWVAPTHRGRGINQIMHRAGEDWCRRLGVRRMVVMIAGHNAASLKATDRSGFTTERVYRSKWL